MPKVFVIASDKELINNALLVDLARMHNLEYTTASFDVIGTPTETVERICKAIPNYLFLGDISERRGYLEFLKNMAKVNGFSIKSIASEKPYWCEEVNWLLGTEPGNILL